VLARAIVADCCSVLSVCRNGSEENLSEAEAASHKVFERGSDTAT